MFCVMRLPRLIAKNKTSARHSLTLNVWLVKHARHSFRIPGIPFAEKLFCNASEEICPPVAINPARGLAAIPQRQPPQLPDAPDRAGGLSDGLSPFPDGNGSSCGRAAAGASAALVGLGYGFRRGTDSAPAGHQPAYGHMPVAYLSYQNSLVGDIPAMLIAHHGWGPRAD